MKHYSCRDADSAKLDSLSEHAEIVKWIFLMKFMKFSVLCVTAY